ncbi:MAG: DUF2330 domain-containing protein [Candidatus Methylacidiphilales bacterium]
MARSIVFISILAAILNLSLALRAHACAITPPPCAPGEENFEKISIADEPAVIIWDKESKTEHFIRQAVFSSSNGRQVNNLGFIVPTPNVPKLEEADPAIFSLAQNISRERIYPPVIHYTPFNYAYIVGPAVIFLLVLLYLIAYANSYKNGRIQLLLVLFAVSLIGLAVLRQLGTTVTAVFSKITVDLESEAPIDVNVLHRQRVAGLDAAILRAGDSRALAEWLRANGYESPAGLDKWLEPYVAGKWIFTAFKLSHADSDKKGKLTGSAVRMSFTTDEPFFPYSEPQEAVPAPLPGKLSSETSSRILRVAVIANERMEGTPLKELTSDNPVPWPGRLLYADTTIPVVDPLEVKPIGPVTANDWLEKARLTEDPIAKRFPTRLTYFIDESMRKTAGDLIFAPAKDQSAFSRSKVWRHLSPAYIYKGDDLTQNSLAALIVLATMVLSGALIRSTIRLLKGKQVPSV